jgi:hypothetical protein
MREARQEPRRRTERETPSQQTRRHFLRNLGAALVAGGVVAPEAVAARREKGRNGNDSLQEYIDFENRIRTFILEQVSARGPELERTPAEQDDVRSDFLAEFGDEIEPAIAAAEEALALGDLFVLLAKVGCQGKIYAALQADGRYEEKDRALPATAIRDYHFFTRVEDFLPTSQEVTEREIDPRLEAAAGGVQTPERWQETIDQAPAWAAPERQAAFLAILDNAGFRERIRSTNLTLAEAYSVIKATVKYRERHDPNESTLAVVEKLLEARDRIAAVEFLGPDTTRFVHLNYSEANPLFDGDLLDDVAQQCGVPSASIRRLEGNSPTVHRELFEAIATSAGPTTMYFNTHGYQDGKNLSLAEQSGDTVNVDQVANALLHRLNARRDPHALADVKILFGSCFSYDFVNNLLQALRTGYDQPLTKEAGAKSVREALGVTVDQVTMPTMMTAAQEGSLGLIKTIQEPLRTGLEAIGREGRLTGDFLLRRVQPQSYLYSDLTFFEGQAGDAVEIAAYITPDESHTA